MSGTRDVATTERPQARTVEINVGAVGEGEEFRYELGHPTDLGDEKATDKPPAAPKS
jgi:hypothetical protein